jgi:biotin carboxylase
MRPREDAGGKDILMVGLHPGYGDVYSRGDDLRMYLLEEPALYSAETALYREVGPDRTILCEYQQSDAFIDQVDEAARSFSFHAVAAAYEYGVRPAGLLASRLGLAYPGDRAVRACTDKAALREIAVVHGIRQPRWGLVRRPVDIRDFDQGVPFIVKPTNRHASVGVVLVENPQDYERVWVESSGTRELRSAVDRYTTSELLVEEYVLGTHVSVELLIRHGSCLFDNVTLLETPGGPYFPIVRVTVPAPLPAEVRKTVVDASVSLASSMDFMTGTLHAEWIIRDGEPFLIECAARVPGVFIPELLGKVYPGFDLYEAHLRNLLGTAVPVPVEARGVASAYWFHPRPGRVVGLDGMSLLEGRSDVFMFRLKTHIGDIIEECRDGWHRSGYFAVHGESAKSVREAVDYLADVARIVTEEC